MSTPSFTPSFTPPFTPSSGLLQTLLLNVFETQKSPSTPSTPTSRLVDGIRLTLETKVKVECLTMEELICDESMGFDKELIRVCSERLMMSVLEASDTGEHRPARRFAEQVPWTRGAVAGGVGTH